MRYILDTNILIHLVSNTDLGKYVMSEYNLLNLQNQVFISITARGEILSIASQRNWGSTKVKILNQFLGSFVLLNLNESIVQKYVEMDAYSQGKDKNRIYSPDFSAKNMGKNDLWIAATAAVTSSTLITTDKDFDHLNTVFIPVIRIDVENYR